MDWIPSSEYGVTLAVGIVAFVGTLLGAGIALISNLKSTSRQLDRQQRDARRAIYGDFLAKAAYLRAHHGDRDKAAAQTFRLRDEVEALAPDAGAIESVKAFEANYGHLAERLNFLRQEKDRLDQVTSQLLAELTADALRLGIIAPPAIYDVARVIVDYLLLATTRSDVPPARDWTVAFSAFRQLARADTQAAESVSWKKVVEKTREVARLQRDLESRMSQEPPTPA